MMHPQKPGTASQEVIEDFLKMVKISVIIIMKNFPYDLRREWYGFSILPIL